MSWKCYFCCSCCILLFMTCFEIYYVVSFITHSSALLFSCFGGCFEGVTTFNKWTYDFINVWLLAGGSILLPTSVCCSFIIDSLVWWTFKPLSTEGGITSSVLASKLWYFQMCDSKDVLSGAVNHTFPLLVVWLVKERLFICVTSWRLKMLQFISRWLIFPISLCCLNFNLLQANWFLDPFPFQSHLKINMWNISTT